ncbi:MAG: site-2 protease family protein [Chitinophagaceae bacterium]
MEHNPISTHGIPEEQPIASAAADIYPRKFVREKKAANVWLQSAVSLAAYLVLGYYIFNSYKMLLVITAIVLMHELGHFFAMKYYRYRDLGIFFIPLLGAYVSGTKREVSQKQSAVILLAGPLPGMILGIGFLLLEKYTQQSYFPFNVALSQIAAFLILLNLINLLPIYPLDGGQLLNRVFLDEDGVSSKIFVFISIGLMCLAAWKIHYILLIFPVMMLLRLRGDSQMNTLDKRIEEADINADVSYEDLSDKDYWEMRNILIEEHADFKHLKPGPPYQYSEKEEKIMTTIQSLLHRHLIQDVSIPGKIFIFLIWIAAIAAPWLIEMDLSAFSRFGL